VLRDLTETSGLSRAKFAASAPGRQRHACVSKDAHTNIEVLTLNVAGRDVLAIGLAFNAGGTKN
jgi:hypothetical protein